MHADVKISLGASVRVQDERRMEVRGTRIMSGHSAGKLLPPPSTPTLSSS